MRTLDLKKKAARERRTKTFTLTLLRVVLGATFVAHGFQKLGDIPGTLSTFTRLGILAPEFSVYVAIFSELLGGFGLVLGMLTRFLALGPLLTTALPLVFVRDAHGLFAAGWEYPLVLCVLCLHFAVCGAGRYSVDAKAVPRPSRFRRRHRHVAVTT
jgi:putative oxidoreductase